MQDLRLRVAVDLAAGGDLREEHSATSRRSLRKTPLSPPNRSAQMLAVFERAGKSADLIEFMNGVDLKALSFDQVHTHHPGSL